MCLRKELLCSLVLLFSCVVSAQSTPINTNSVVSTRSSTNINTNSGSAVSTHSSTHTFDMTSTVLQSDEGPECNCGQVNIIDSTTKGKAKEKHYYISDLLKVNWFQAMQICRNLGMQPLSIASEEEYNKLTEQIKDSSNTKTDYWTSGSDLGEEGTFIWMGNGRPVIFTAWAKGEPNNNGGACIELLHRSNWEFNDDKCNTKKYFICEY